MWETAHLPKVGERESRAGMCGRGAMEKTAGRGKQQGEETAAKKQRHRYGSSEKASQPYRMTGGAAMRGVRVL